MVSNVNVWSINLNIFMLRFMYLSVYHQILCVIIVYYVNVIECVMNPDSWPAGLLVKRFYHARQDGE